MFHDVIQSISNIPIAAILTISMIVVLLLSVLFGVLRGLKKSIFYIIFYVIGVVVFFLTLGSLTDAMLNFDLSNFGLNINGVNVSTLNESVPEIFRSFLPNGNNANLDGMFVSGTESYILVTSLMKFGVQLLLTITFIVFFQIIYKIIIWLFWIIFGKRIFKAKKRVRGQLVKLKKKRLLGGVLGLVPGLISVFMLFVPISGIFSVASSLTSGQSETGVSFGDYLSKEDYEKLQKALGSYEESVPGQVFNIAVNQDGASLDVMVFDTLMNVKVDDQNINIRKDLENIGKFASNIVATGLLDVVLNDSFTSNELIEVVNTNSKLINSAFESLGEVELIDLIMNTGVEYLDNSRIVDEKLELTTDSIKYENLSKLDWSNEFKQMGNILKSSVGLLEVLPETEKSKPLAELGSLSVETVDKLDGEKTQGATDLFIEELFKSNLINEASTAGLEYVLGTKQVKEIVGEVDKEALKDVDLKEDLLKVSSALKSVIVITINNFANVNLQELSNQSIELKNIIDELLELEVFKVVEKNVIDYTITNYVEKDANITKFVDVEELRKLDAADFKIELGALVETFGELGEKTKLFNVEGLENKNAKMNYDALDSKALKIINENVEESATIYKFLNQALQGAFVPTIYENEEAYQESVKKFEGSTEEETRENWVYEIDIFAKLLESVENEMAEVNESFSIYRMATSNSKSIKIGVLRGLSAKDPLNSTKYNHEYYLDESQFVRDIMMNTVSKSASGNELFDGLFDDPTLEYGKELDSFTDVIIESEIIDNPTNASEVVFETLEEQFYVLNEAKLNAFTNHVEDSILLQRILQKNLKGQVSQELSDEMESWKDTPGRWHDELVALDDILLNGGFADENNEISFNDDFGDKLNEVSYPQLDVISKNINNSLIVQDILTTTLTSETTEEGEKVITNQDLYDKMHSENFDWESEIGVIRDIVKSETYEIVQGTTTQWSTMPLDELTSISCLRPETLEFIAKNINKTEIIKDSLVEPLTTMLTYKNDENDPNDDVLYNDCDPNVWTDAEWDAEMKSIAYVAKPLAKSNQEKNNNNYPSDRVYIDFNNITIENEIKLEVLENLLGYSEEEPNQIKELFRKFFRINPLKSNEITNEYGIHKSNILRKLFVDGMNDNINKADTIEDEPYVVNFAVEYDQDGNYEEYYYEVEALCNAINNSPIDNPLYNVCNGDETNIAFCQDNAGIKYINFTELRSKFENISPDLFEVISLEVPKSEILQKQIQKTLHPNLDEKVKISEYEEKTLHDFTVDVMDTWGKDKWSFEMAALNNVVQTLPTEDSGKINFNIGTTVRVSTIEETSNNSNSDIVRRTMRDTINNELLVIKRMSRDDNPLTAIDETVVLPDVQTPIHSDDWNNYQWKYELEVLAGISDRLAKDDNVDAEGEKIIDTSKFDEYMQNVNIEFLEFVKNSVYSDIKDANGNVIMKLNSYILQAQLSPTIEELMNAGDRIDASRIRELYPEDTNIGDGTINWNIGMLLPDYETCDPTDYDNLSYYYNQNSAVGEWWHNEINTMYLVVKDKNDGNSVNLKEMPFNETKISTLNVIRDNIYNSYVLQSSMRNTIDAILNQDYNSGYLKYSYYDVLSSEYWTSSQWLKEMTAIRNVAKTIAIDETVTNFETVVENSFAEHEDYVVSSWVVDETNDNNYIVEELVGMGIKDSNQNNAISLDTLYYISEYSKETNIVRSLLRPHIIDILNVNGELEVKDASNNVILDNNNKPVLDDKFMAEWNNDSGVENYLNRWEYEMKAMFNVAGQVNNNGFITMNSSMFNKVELSVISSLNGAFTDDHRVDESRIKDDHGYVADYNGQQYQSEFIISLLTDSLRSDRVDPQTWNNNPEQWRYEIFALEEISQLIAENGYVDFNNLPISKEKGIDVNLLSCLSEVINYSTYIQDKLVDEMFKIEDETRREELEAAFPKANSFSLEVNQWNGEMASLYNVINGNTTYVINNKFMYDGLTFSESTPIDANLLRNVGENINQSTFLQYKLESTVEGLVPSEGDEYYVLDRTEYFEENFRNNDHEHVFDGVTDHNCTVAGCGYIKDYHLNRVVESGNVRYEFDMEIKYDDPYYHAWTVELKTIFGIVLDDENGMVSIDPTTGNEVVVLNKIKEQLHTLSINILTLASDMLDYYGHDEYHSSNIVRLNLIRPLEEFAYNTTDQAYLDAEAQMKYTSGLKWIDIPIDNAIPHNFTYDQNSDGSYSITNGALHRYDGENSFEIAGNKLIANFNGWSKAGKYIYELKNAVDDPNTVEDESNDAATLYLDEQNSNDNKKIYIKKGLDRDGNIHDLYKIEVNSDGTGIWYCINQRSDLHELETFFKLIGADDLGSAKSILSNTNIGDENNIINVLNDPEIKQQVLVLEDESYLIGKTFANRGISAYL